MNEVISSTGAHYRIDPQDATIIQYQARHRARWIRYVTCQAQDGYTAEQIAAAWLEALGDPLPNAGERAGEGVAA